MTEPGIPSASTISGGSVATGNGPSGRRLVIILAAAVVVILLIVGGVVAATSGGGSAKPAASASSTPSASPSRSASTSPKASASVSPAPSRSRSPRVDPAYGVPVAKKVPKAAPGDFGDGVTFRIAAITSVTAKGTQAGEVSGPAAQVDMKLMNGTSAGISLSAITVNAYYGADKTPASPIDSSSGRGGFSGTLAAGKAVTARFVFSASTAQQKSLVVTISRDAGGPVIVFQ